MFGLPLQLQQCHAIDLCCLVWALSRLVLLPPTSWLLSFYSVSQKQLQGFTHAQLATLAVCVDRLLLPTGQLPPVVWQLELELQVKQRRKRLMRHSWQQQQRQEYGSSVGGFEPASGTPDCTWQQQEPGPGVAGADDRAV